MLYTDGRTDRRRDEVHSFNPLHLCGGGFKLGKTPKNKSKTNTEKQISRFLGYSHIIFFKQPVPIGKGTNEH